MSFQNRPNQEPMSEINVTPLVDVMLVLLVVFIVTAPLLTQSVSVKLPKVIATGDAGKVLAHKISMDAYGAMRLDTTLISEQELATKLGKLASTNPNFELQVDADAEVAYGKVAQVIAIAQRSGVEKLTFVHNMRANN